MVPFSVNLLALPSRLNRICRSLGDVRVYAAQFTGVQDQLVALLVHQRRGGVDHAFEERAHRQLLQAQLHLSCLDLGKIEYVVDQPQQMFAGDMNLFQVRYQIDMAIVLGFLGQQFAVADNRVQGRAQFMAHVGQIHAL